MVDEGNVNVEQWWNYNERENQNFRRKLCPSATLSPPRISHGLVWALTVTCRWETADMAQPDRPSYPHLNCLHQVIIPFRYKPTELPVLSYLFNCNRCPLFLTAVEWANQFFITESLEEVFGTLTHVTVASGKFKKMGLSHSSKKISFTCKIRRVSPFSPPFAH